MWDPSNNFGKTENKVKLEVFLTIIKSISPSSIFAFGAIFISLPTYLVLHAIIKEKAPSRSFPSTINFESLLLFLIISNTDAML